ncbi:MAG: chemotaxis protein CheB [Nitrospirota bacterium]
MIGTARDGEEAIRAVKTMSLHVITSVVHGMPGEAIRLGAAMYILTPEEIASALIGMVGKDD